MNSIWKWLTAHYWISCPKKSGHVTSQQKKSRVSVSFWQKVRCSLSYTFTFVEKLLVANILCSSVNWKDNWFWDLFAQRRLLVNCVTINVFLGFGFAVHDPFSLSFNHFFSAFCQKEFYMLLCLVVLSLKKYHWKFCSRW